MKKEVLVIVTVSFAICGVARWASPFRGWDELQKTSPEIVIVRCGKPVPPTGSVSIMNAPRSDSASEVLYHLKGTNNASRLWTDHQLCDGINYLVFGYINNETLVAYERYNVVPIGNLFETNWIAGKALNDQIQILFGEARFYLDREIKEDQEQKAQLESGITKH